MELETLDGKNDSSSSTCLLVAAAIHPSPRVMVVIASLEGRVIVQSLLPSHEPK